MTRADLVHWRTHGWLLLKSAIPARLAEEAAQEAEEELPPGDVDLFADLTGTARQFAAMKSFPFTGQAACAAATSDVVGIVAQKLLRTRRVQLFQAQLWAKYGNVGGYEQTHHRDYAKNTMLVPSRSLRPDFVGMLLYLTDVGLSSGPTALVSLTKSRPLPLEPARYARDEAPYLYDKETYAVGPAGSLLIYRDDVFHRATEVTAGERRLVIKLAVKRADAHWVNYHQGIRIGFEPEWSRFFLSASSAQLKLLGAIPADGVRRAKRERYAYTGASSE